jgi:AraC-like DNA-binding protein
MLWVRSLTLAMSNLFESIDDHRLPEGLVLDQVGGCLALACRGLERDATRYRIGFGKDIVETLRTNHGDPNLSPTDVATQHRISKRYLHAIFASLGTTFGRELLAIRLARAEALLRDDRYRRSSIGEIATLCGFSDPAHFARRFRQSRGQSPALFRQLMGR